MLAATRRSRRREPSWSTTSRDIFESLVDVIGDREALVCGDRRLTFAQLEERANRLAHHLLRIGVSPATTSACSSTTAPSTSTTMVACFKVRAVPVNVNYRYVEEELLYLFNDADLVALVHDTEFTAADQRGPRPGTAAARASSRSATARRRRAPSTSTTRSRRSDERAGLRPRSADDLYIIYTGGTTGMPKGVMWRQEDIFFAGMGGGDPVGTPVTPPEEVAERAPTRGPLVMFPVAPLMHGAAQLATWIGFLQASKVVLVRKFDAIDVIETAKREGVNSLSIVGDAMARPIAEALAGPLKGTELPSVFVAQLGRRDLLADGADLLQELLPNVDADGQLRRVGDRLPGHRQGGLQPRRRPEVHRQRPHDRARRRPQADRARARARSAASRSAGMCRSATTRTRSRRRKASSRSTASAGCCSVTPRRSRRTARSRSSVGTRCASTPAARRSIPEEVEAALKAHPAIYDAVVTGVPDERFGSKVTGAGPAARRTSRRRRWRRSSEHCTHPGGEVQGAAAGVRRTGDPALAERQGRLPVGREARQGAAARVGAAERDVARHRRRSATPPASQLARRERILDAAVELASEGGYDAVQMREVAERADVALGTLYRYFPSKVHLLVSAMGRTFSELQDSVQTADPAVRRRSASTASSHAVTRYLAKNRRLSGAMVRALMIADADAGRTSKRSATLWSASSPRVARAGRDADRRRRPGRAHHRQGVADRCR